MIHGSEYLVSRQKRRIDLFVAKALAPVELTLVRSVRHARKDYYNMPDVVPQQREGRNLDVFSKYIICTHGDNDQETPIGKLVREAGLDEVANRRNILAGEMSAIGRRALAPGVLGRIYDIADANIRDEHMSLVLPFAPGLFSEIALSSHISAPKSSAEDVMSRDSVNERLTQETKYAVDACLAADLNLLADTGSLCARSVVARFKAVVLP